MELKEKSEAKLLTKMLQIAALMQHCGANTPLSLPQRSPLTHSTPPITQYYYGAVARTPTPAYTYTVQSTHQSRVDAASPLGGWNRHIAHA